MSVDVVMHLLALGAFWREVLSGRNDRRHHLRPAHVVMHLLALGAFWLHALAELYDALRVVMHLLALGAIWHIERN